ncbi:LacI family DNA-binding transcriptional regulator [Sphaerisporangium sp. NPDC051011]|uniref:LacI family DNA-binding transcriptional regulator n=1 Tax=Sphaerisporangium sp. NPDC051011 TaxID=3155792 RepID=UPI0033FC8FF5
MSGRNQPVTLADVAARAQVSAQTVSNVLHRPDRVLPKTRKKVEAAIKELGYQPNRAARALRANTSHIIGFRIEPTSTGAVGSIHDRFLHALAEAARPSGHHIQLFTADAADAEAATASQLWRAGAVDAVVLYDIVADDPRPGLLLDKDVPFVSFGRTLLRPTTYSWVDVDDENGIHQAVDHLVSQGHRRIGYIGWPEHLAVGVRRARGWHDAMRLNALPTDLDARADDTIAAGRQAAASLLSTPDPPTAIIAATDTIAVGIHHEALHRDLRPGKDLAIIGFDDTPTAYAMALSSIGQPVADVARAIMNLLLELLNAPQAPPTQGRLLAPHLIIRDSSSRPCRL